MNDWKWHAIGILLGFLVFVLVYTFANAEPREDGRETFEVACSSLENARTFAASLDWNACYHFYERFGFQPWGFLKHVETVGEFDIYEVVWGNGASGVYAVK